jgi:hypothetical protein
MGRAFLEDGSSKMQREAMLAALDRMVAATLRLLALARGRAPTDGEPPAVGEPTLAALAQSTIAVATGVGYQRPRSIAEADQKVAARQACPPGASMAGVPGCSLPDTPAATGQMDRPTYRAEVRRQLGAAGQAFFEECRDAKDAIEAEIARDSKWAEIVTDVLVTALIMGGGEVAGAALGGGAHVADEAAHDVAAAEKTTAWAASHGTAHAAAHDAGLASTHGAGAAAEESHVADTIAGAAKHEVEAEGGHGLELLADSLKETAVASTVQAIRPEARAENGDTRNSTLSMLDALGKEVVDALKTFGETKLELLTDDALLALYVKLSGDLESIREAAKTFIGKFRQQVEAVGTVSYNDPRMIRGPLSGLLGIENVVGTTAVWIVGAGTSPRLAVVREIGQTTSNVMTGRLPDLVDVDAYEFITWVDPKFLSTVATRATASVPIGEVRGAAEGANAKGEGT